SHPFFGCTIVRADGSPAYRFVFGHHNWNAITREDVARSYIRGIPAQAGRTYRVVVEKNGDRLNFSVDGKTILSFKDVAPLSIEGGRTGLLALQERVRYDDCRLEALESKASLATLVSSETPFRAARVSVRPLADGVTARLARLTLADRGRWKEIYRD